MPLVTHVFKQQQRIQGGRIVANDPVSRRANFDYDLSGINVVITIEGVLSPKKARLLNQNGFMLTYLGEDPSFRFELECWSDNGTIKRLSVYRTDTGVEYRYISDHQDRM